MGIVPVVGKIRISTDEQKERYFPSASPFQRSYLSVRSFQFGD